MLESPVAHIALIGPILIAVVGLLVKISFDKPKPRRHAENADASDVVPHIAPPVYRRILVPLDHSNRDRAAIAHASALALPHRATLYLLHIEEDVTSQVFGEIASTAETLSGREHFEAIVRALGAAGISAELTIEHGRPPREAIVALAREIKPDLVVMGAHGHRGLKDLIFGTTINAVRHQISVPVLVVGDEPPTR